MNIAGISTEGCCKGFVLTWTILLMGMPSVSATVPEPPNDRLHHATKIPAVPFAAQLDTRGATRTQREDVPTSCQPRPRATVWYTFTAPRSMMIGAHTVGSNYIPTLTSYRGSSDGLREVTCSSAKYQGEEPRIRFRVTAGDRYWIAVGDVDGQGGHLRFNVTPLSTPPRTHFEARFAPEQGYDAVSTSAVIKLRVTCTEPVTFVFRRGVLKQGDHDVVEVRQGFQDRVACYGRRTRSYILQSGGGGAFVPGPAYLSFEVRVTGFYGGMSNWVDNQPVFLGPSELP